MRIKYLKYANDSRVPLGDFIKLARALTNMLKANTSIDRFYGPQEEDESAGEDNESGTDPETNDKSNRA